MSFGISVGDFIAVGRLIKDIVSTLHSAEKDYLELILELHSLERALYEVEHLDVPPNKEVAVNAVKVAALLCHHPLKQFKQNLEQYHVLDAGRKKPADIVKSWGRKAQWSFSMPDEANKLRIYLSAHVGSLNMRLITLGVSLTVASGESTDTTLTAIQTNVSNVSGNVNDLRDRVDELQTVSLTLEENVKLLFDLVSSTTLPMLTALFDLAFLTFALLSRLPATSPIDTGHTWFQKPLKFEDAFGRVLPVPSEYGFSTLQSIILDRFNNGPASERVLAGEYELFKSLDCSQILQSANFELIAPGTSITMAMVIGRYEALNASTCPKPGCGSQKTRSKDAGGRECDRCRTWFGQSRTIIPRPFVKFRMEPSTISAEPFALASLSINRVREILQSSREERKWFKNVRLHQTSITEAAALFRGDKSRSKNEELTLISAPRRTPMGTDLWPQVRKILSDELGNYNEIEGDVELEYYGFDSLMMIGCFHRLETELGVNLPDDLFMGHKTAEALREYFENFDSACGDQSGIARSHDNATSATSALVSVELS